MARPFRIVYPGAWYHVTSRGIERRSIFTEARDRYHFLDLLPLMRERFAVNLYAYVLMQNHYHLLLQTSEPNLSQTIQWLNVSYSVWFNRRHNRVGPLFQGRFKALVVEPERWALALSRYLHLNPVRIKRLGLDKTSQKANRRGMAATPAPELVRQRLGTLNGFRWSSYPCYIGKTQIPDWLDAERILCLGGGSSRQWARQYQQACEAALGQATLEEPACEVAGSFVLGSRAFVQSLSDKVKGKEPLREQLRRRPLWSEIVSAVERVRGEPWKDFAERRGDFGRDLALYFGRRFGGMTLSALGKLAAGMKVMAVSLAVKRFAQKLETDKQLRKATTAVEKLLFNV